MYLFMHVNFRRLLLKIFSYLFVLIKKKKSYIFVITHILNMLLFNELNIEPFWINCCKNMHFKICIAKM